MPPAHKHTHRWFWFSLGTMFLAASLSIWLGCGVRNDAKVKQKDAGQDGAHELQAEQTSASSLLDPGDYDKFRPGRSKTDVLNDVQWRGNFEFATTIDGRNVAAISFGVFGGPMSRRGKSVLAIFVDDEFQKLVRWPRGDAKIKIGDFGILNRALASEAVTFGELETETREHSRTTHTHIDPGLTAVWLGARKGIEVTMAPALAENARLRDQFNAARLRLGMSGPEVESALNAKPIESGEVDAGTIKLYGSAKPLGITTDLHYSNVLVLLEDDKVIGIYSGGLVPGGDGVQRMRNWFTDLPALSKNDTR